VEPALQALLAAGAGAAACASAPHERQTDADKQLNARWAGILQAFVLPA